MKYPYLEKRVSDATRIQKQKRGLCRHWGCSNPRREKRSDCETCKSRKRDIQNAARRVFRSIKSSAKRRNIPFTLTFPQFMDFDAKTGYLAKRGRKHDSLSIDRISSSRGYEVGNIRAVTWIENCRRRIEGMQSPVEPIAKALAEAEGHGIYQRCLGRAEDVYTMVTLLEEIRLENMEPAPF